MNALQVNGKLKATQEEVPDYIATRTTGLEPMLRAWRKGHWGVPWAVLVRLALVEKLERLDGKRIRAASAKFATAKLK